MTEHLTPAWTDTLDRLKRRRSSPILMPAAILVALDVLAETKGSGDIPFGDFERRFDRLVGEVDSSKTGSGWQPFYHLSGEASVWQLLKGGRPASFSDLAKGRPRSRAALVARADSARVSPELLSAVAKPAGIAAVRSAISKFLTSDSSPAARSLANAISSR